jgi:4-amino-4-deoxy-L-arabinose transferase-like glycosyltransferase
MASSISQVLPGSGVPSRILEIDPIPKGRVSSSNFWLLEKEGVLLVLVVVATYFLRLGDMSIRGEESRWATVAREMLRTGDWVVPRQQGIPFLSRPPLESWLIAVTTLVRGDCDPLAVRLPSVIGILLTTLLVYGYSRNFLSRLGALSAGLAFATMGQVMQLGRLAETEAVFTFLVSASLLVWHWGYFKEWPMACTWMAGYVLAALGALAKGPQAPAYFTASVGFFLLLRRDWRMLISWSHLLGMIVFTVVIGCWQIPFYLKLGGVGVKAIWMSDTAMRLWEMKLPDVSFHLVTYPVEIVACTLPWSLLLLEFLSRDFRRRIGEARPAVMFLVTCLAVTFPTCWLVPGAHGRYYMPLFPCLAPLIGLIVQRCIESEPFSFPRRVWQVFMIAMACAMIAFSLAVVSASWLGFPKISLLIQDREFALVYGAVVCAIAGLVCWIGLQNNRRTAVLGVVAVACFLGVTQSGVVLNFMVRKNGTTADEVSQLKANIQKGQELVSFGPVHHLFAYHFRDPIALRPWPRDADDPAGDVSYFCFEQIANPPLPFPWMKVAVISCDRDRTAHPEEAVIVGRRLPLLLSRRACSPSPPGKPGG